MRPCKGCWWWTRLPDGEEAGYHRECTGPDKCNGWKHHCNETHTYHCFWPLPSQISCKWWTCLAVHSWWALLQTNTKHTTSWNTMGGSFYEGSIWVMDSPTAWILHIHKCGSRCSFGVYRKEKITAVGQSHWWSECHGSIQTIWCEWWSVECGCCGGAGRMSIVSVFPYKKFRN